MLILSATRELSFSSLGENLKQRAGTYGLLNLNPNISAPTATMEISFFELGKLQEAEREFRTVL